MGSMMKYVVTNETKVVNGETLYRIQSLADFKTIDGKKVEKGSYGGYITNLNCLSQYGQSWIKSGAYVFDGRVSGNALVAGRASVYGGHILDKAIIKGKAKVIESTIYGSAVVQDNTRVNNSTVGDTSIIKDNAVLDDRAVVFGNSIIRDDAKVVNYSQVLDGLIKDSSVIDHSSLDAYHVTGKSLVRNVLMCGKGDIIDSTITSKKHFYLHVTCGFEKAHITDISQFFFIPLGHRRMAYVAIYPNVDGELMASYRSCGDSHVVTLKELDRRVRDEHIVTEEFWDKFLSLARMFQNENVKVKDPWE